MEIRSNLLAAQLAKSLGGRSPFGEHLVEQGDQNLSADQLREAMLGFDGFVDGEKERVELLITGLTNSVDSASFKAAMAEFRSASAAIPAREVPGPVSKVRSVNEPFRLGDAVRSQVLEATGSAVSQTLMVQFDACGPGSAPRMPAPTTIRDLVLNAIWTDPRGLTSGDPAVALASPAVESAFAYLAINGRIFVPRHLDELKKVGFQFSAELEATALRLAQKEVELYAYELLRSVPPGSDGRKNMKPAGPFRQSLSGVIAACAPVGADKETERALFNQSLTEGLQRAVQEGLVVSPAHLAGFEGPGYGYVFPDSLKEAVIGSAQAHVADAVWNAFNPINSSNRVIKRSPGGPALAAELAKAIALHFTEELKGREVELYGPSVDRGFDRLLRDGRTISVEEAAAVETQMNVYLGS